MDLQIFRKDFNNQLLDYIEKKISNSKKLVNNNKIIFFLEYLKPYIFSGGKRIRPYIFYLTYLSFAKNIVDLEKKHIFQFSMIFEILHTMALVHDDIIDESSKRHNVETIHIYINHKINNSHISNSQALLIGDLLLSWVYEFLNKKLDFDDNIFLGVKKNIQEMIEEVILGQMIDVDMMLGELADEKDIEIKNLYKTAKYSFTRPMISGALFAKVDKMQLSMIQDLGTELGLAFQVRDDLFDLLGLDETKSQFSDIQEGQQTIFTNYIFFKGKNSEKNILKKYLGKKLSFDEIDELKNIFESSGAIGYGKQLIHKHLKNAEVFLNRLDFFDKKQKVFFEKLIAKLIV